MWRKVRPIVLAVSVALNVALLSTWAVRAIPAHLARRPSAGQPQQPEIWCPMHRELGLTTEQWKKIEPQMLRFHRQIREQRGKLKGLREEMFELLRADRADREKMKAQQEKILQALRGMQDIVLDHLLAEKRLLTDAQQSRLFEMVKRRMQSPGPSGPMMGPGRNGGSGIGRTLRNTEGKKSKR